MATALTAKQCVEVVLVRPDVGPQTFTLREGATLADLLRESGAAIGSPNVLIDGRPIEDAMTLKSGMSITILPERPEMPAKRSWRDTVGMFADDHDFEAMVEAGRAYREADRKSTLEEIDREEAAGKDS
jgi:hypothetical protein